MMVSVDASTSYDPDGTIVSYAWNWGDGSTGHGITATHTYAADGTYTVTLTVTDNYGMTDSTSKNIQTVPPPIPPAFTIFASGLTVSVDASVNDDPSITSIAWDWGDGSTGSGITATHTYASGGTHTITMIVTYDSGSTFSVSKVVVFPHYPPIASFICTISLATIRVDASASVDVDGTIVSYAWNWGDGSPDGSGVTASHTYLEVFGTYTITLTITDDDGLTGSMTRSITIS
jgi:PKD repeat protein